MSSFYHGLVVYRGPGQAYDSKQQNDIDKLVDSTPNIVGRNRPFTGYGRRGFVPIDTLLSADYAFTTPPAGKYNHYALAALNVGLQAMSQRFNSY